MRRTLAVAMAATLTVGIAACSSDSAQNESKTATQGGNLTFAIAGGNLENGHMDPHASQLDVSAYVMRNVLDSLVALDANGDLKPWLATAWTVSPDAKTYVFELRQDVTFHDGEQFNAAAAVANFNHIMAEETASAQARAFIGGDLFDKAEATGEFELTLTLKEPYAPLLANLSTAFVGMYSPKVLESKSQDDIKAGGPDVSVGTGPFVLTELSPKNHITFSANTNYAWGPDVKTSSGASLAEGAPYLDTLTVRIVPEESARVGALQSSDAQVAVDLTPTSTAQLNGANINTTASPGIPYSVYLNWSHGVFSDPKVRQAFQRGVNIDAGVKAAFANEFQRAWSVLSPTTPNAYDSSLENAWPYDEAAANTLLDEAGWTERDAEGYRVKDGKRLSAEWLSWLPFPDERQALVNFMVDDLKKIGFELTHSAVEGPEYSARYADENGLILDFDLTDWSFASLDADALRQHLHTGGFQNATTVSDEKLDSTLDEAASTTDAGARKQAYADVQQWNLNEVAVVPVYLSQFTTASLPSVSGLTYDAYGWPLFAGVSLNP